MARKRHTAEEIVGDLRQVAVLDSSLGYRPPAPEVISWPARQRRYGLLDRPTNQ